MRPTGWWKLGIASIVAGCSGDAGDPAGGSGDPAAGGPCREAASCPAADATRKPQIACVQPGSVPVGDAVTLHIFGSYLQDSRGGNTKVALDGTTGIEGVPTSACHLTLDIPPRWFTSARDVKVVVATAVESDEATLLVR
jgi:hypothetical protein